MYSVHYYALIRLFSRGCIGVTLSQTYLVASGIVYNLKKMEFERFQFPECSLFNLGCAAFNTLEKVNSNVFLVTKS